MLHKLLLRRKRWSAEDAKNIVFNWIIIHIISYRMSECFSFNLFYILLMNVLGLKIVCNYPTVILDEDWRKIQLSLSLLVRMATNKLCQWSKYVYRFVCFHFLPFRISYSSDHLQQHFSFILPSFNIIPDYTRWARINF